MCNGPKQTISVNGGLGLLQIVSKPDTGRCASENAGLSRRVDYGIPPQLERRMKHSL